MTKNLSSLEDFRVFLNQLKHQSPLVKIVGVSKRFPNFDMLGRVTGVGPSAFRFRGRGLEVDFNLGGATFECLREVDLPVVTIPTAADPGAAHRPTWLLSWRNGDSLAIGEYAPK